MGSDATWFKPGHSFLQDGGWTPEEVALLKAFYSSTPVSELAEKLAGRTVGAIYSKARNIGLRNAPTIAAKSRGAGLARRYENDPTWQERQKKLGQALARSPAHHRRKCGEYTLPEESRKKIAASLRRVYKVNAAVKRRTLANLVLARGVMRLKHPSGPELKVAEMLRGLGVDMIPQKRIGGFRVDFAVQATKIAVLVDGCYWHCCPNHFPLAMSQSQQHTLLVDGKRDKALKKAGWRVLHIWEHEIEEATIAVRIRKEVTRP